MPKRRKTDDVDETDDPTPRKTRRTAQEDAVDVTPKAATETPSKRKSILKETPTKMNGAIDAEPTPKSLRKVLFQTPSQAADDVGEERGGLNEVEDTPTTAARNDRSARKKSALALQQQHRPTEESDEEEDPRAAALAEEILREQGGSEDDVIPVAEASSTNTTLKKRGRPKGRRRERTPSPPPDLPPHELYFFQNRGGAGNKTSANTLPPNSLLNHEDFFAQTKAFKDPHEADIKRLASLHERGFEQWRFELQEGFNICLYGYGSKRELAMDFAQHLHDQTTPAPKIVVVNGYTPGLTLRDILTTVASTLLPKTAKLPAQPPALLDLILNTLTNQPSTQPLHLTIHSLDHPNLRKPATQTHLARLTAHPSLTLVATCDTPTYPLLWDTTLLRQYRWLHHDATTFAPWTAELDPVEDVNALLGRSGRRLGGKDGVAYVLQSLPENARRLFALLVAEQLALAHSAGDVGAGAGRWGDADDEEDLLGVEDDDEAASAQQTPSKRRRGRPEKKKKTAPRAANVVSAGAVEGVEYRTLYHKAVAEFVCSSEVNFRTLLKEFHDHQMVESQKDVGGVERLIVPFGQDELEGWLEELV